MTQQAPQPTPDQNDASTASLKRLGDQTDKTNTSTSVLTDTMLKQGKVSTEITNSSVNLTEVFKVLGIEIDNVGDVTKKLNDTYESYKMSMEVGRGLQDSQVQGLALMSSMALGATKSFESLNYAQTGLVTFTSKWAAMKQYLDSPLLKGTAEGANLLKDALTKAGAPMSAITGAAQKGYGALESLGTAFFGHADNALKLGTAYLSLSAASGNLYKVQGGSKGTFDTVNSQISEQSDMIDKAASSLHILAPQMQAYYLELGKVPGALTQMVTTSENAGTKISFLTAATALSIGTGRNMQDVIGDLTTAYKEYGLVGENALLFTSRITEISSKLNIKLSDVQEGLTKAAADFRGLADAGKSSNSMAEGMAESMNQYVASLQRAGSTSRDAISIFGGLTEGIKGMKTEQKAFLSAQTGGPGGFLGAFQIDKMMKSGDIAGVMDKVKKQIKQQMGTDMIGTDDVKTQADAARMQRQIQIMRQGPLGGMAKTDSDAYRLIDSFKGKSGEKTEALSKDNLQETMKAGVNWQEKSHTELDKIRENLDSMRAASDVPALDMIQSRFTASSGRQTSGDLEGSDARKRREMLKADTARSLETQKEPGKGGTNDFMFDSFGNLIRTTKTYIGKAQESIGKAGESHKTQKTDSKHFTPHAKGPGGIGAPNSRPMPAGYQVGQAAMTASAKGHAMGPGGVGPQQGHNHPMTPGQPQGGPVELQFTAVCDHCRRNLEVSKQGKATSTAK